jgi:hypothetical protein
MSNDQVIAVEFQDKMMYLRLADGRVIGNPLEWHPGLKRQHRSSAPTSKCMN